MTELDTLERTLALARSELAASPEQDARVRQGLGLRPPGHGGSSLESAPRSWRALRASGVSGLVAGALLAGAAGGVGYWLGRAAPQRAFDATPSSALVHDQRGTAAAVGLAPELRRTGPSVPEPDSLEPHATAVPGSDASSPAAPRPPVPSASAAGQAIDGGARSASAAPASGSLSTSAKRSRAPRSLAARAPAQRVAPVGDAADELSLLRRVEKSLRANDPALALALLGDLDERFPRTALGEERLAARVIAHCTVGDGGARLRAESFLRERPGSVYAERVQTACTIPADRPKP
jgi:hypothetical protein